MARRALAAPGAVAGIALLLAFGCDEPGGGSSPNGNVAPQTGGGDGGGGAAGDAAGAEGGDVAEPAGPEPAGVEPESAEPESPEPDGADPEPSPEPAPASCNPITGTGCDEGTTCSFEGQADKPSCVEAGDVPVGGSCKGADARCAEGICLTLEDSEPLCYEFCKIQGHCPGTDQCIEIVDEPFKVCELPIETTPCTLLDLGACGPGKGCFLVGGDDGPICRSSGGVPAGGVCEAPNDCADGLACINVKCRKLCTDDDQCGDEFVSCADYYGEVGYCPE